MMANMKIKTLTSVWIIFLFYGCSITNGSCPQGKPSIFLAEPRDITVNEGSDVSFYCVINLTENSSSELSITWDVNPGDLRKTVVRQNTTSNLTVYNIGREEREHYIRCKVNFRSSNHRETCRYSSIRAKMTVQYFPRQDELTCSTPNRSLSVQEGDSLQIQCQVTQGNPSIDIGWRFDGHSFRQKPSTDNGLMRTSAQRVRISRSMHGQYLICVATSRFAFPGEKISCSIGPLDVQSETRSGIPEDTTADVTTLIPTIDSTTDDFLINSSTYLPILFATNLVLHQATTDTSETMESRWNRWKTLVVVCAISGALLAILLTTTITAIVYILDKCKKEDRSQAYHGQTTIEISRKDSNASVHVVDHLYEDPDIDQDTADILDITHTYFVDTLPSSLSTSPDSSTYFSEAFSSVYDDKEEEYYQPLTKLPEVIGIDIPCSSVYQNQNIVDMHSVSGKNARKGRPLYRRPPSDHPRGSHHPKEPKPPKLPMRADLRKGSHLIEIGDVPSLGPSVLSGLSCHSPLSPSVSHESSTYFSEARSSDYDDDEEEYYQPSKKLPEVTSCDSPCSSVYQNQNIVDIHSVSGKNARKGQPLYRRPPSDHPRGSHRPKEPKPPKLPVRAKPMKGSHLIEIGDVPSLGPSLLCGLSCHSPLSPSVSTALSPVTNLLSSSTVPISPSLSPTSCSSVSSSLPCHSKSSEPRSISLPTSLESSPRSKYIFPAFSSLQSIYHTNTSRRPKSDALIKENNPV